MFISVMTSIYMVNVYHVYPGVFLLLKPTHTHTHKQTQPLVTLIPEPDPESEDKKVLMCSYLPQQGPRNSSMGKKTLTSI